MSTIQERDAEVDTSPLWHDWKHSHPTIAQLIRDRRALLAAGDLLYGECEDAREWLASRAVAPEVQERIEAARAAWKKATG